MKVILRSKATNYPMKCRVCKDEIKVGESYVARRSGVETHKRCVVE